MGFAGNLRTLALAEVIQTLNRIKAEGVLRLASPRGTRDIIFKAGDIIAVSNRDGGEHRIVLHRLTLMGKIRAAEPQEIEEAEATLRTLLEVGTISHEDIEDLRHQQALEDLYDLNTWEAADFLFHEASEGNEYELVVQDHAQHPLELNVTSILMEGARRRDEGARVKDAFKDGDVPNLVPGREPDSGEYQVSFPGNVLVPQIDGTRSVAEILHLSGVTRFSSFSVLHGLQEDGILVLLSADDLRSAADAAAVVGDKGRAARLYRHLLEMSPEDSAATQKLVACLDELGESAEAAACQAQLALTHLGNGDPASARLAAEEAVRLDGTEAKHRGILIRCLLTLEEHDQALDLLEVQANQFEEGGLREEARDTWRKMLELRPGDDRIRHGIARLQEDSGGSGDVVLCIECATVNSRDNKACSKCGARLDFGCLACGRTVSVSDRICIFCGANPHVTSAGHQMVEHPGTERVNEPSGIRPEVKEKGSAFWRAEIRRLLDLARGHEEANRLAEALAAWRELSRVQAGDGEIVAHIRELESLVHDQYIESQIVAGHDLRKHRSYWRALTCYRNALRGIADGDGRRPRLEAIVRSTARSKQRLLVVYGSALLLLLGTGALAGKPYVDSGRIAAAATHASTSLAADLNPEGIRQATQIHQRLLASATGLRGTLKQRAGSALSDLEAEIAVASLRMVSQALDRAQAELAADRPQKAIEALAGFDEFATVRLPDLVALREKSAARLNQMGDLAKRRAQAGDTLVTAKAEAQAGRLADALARFQDLAALDAGAPSEEAQKLARDLLERRAVFEARLVACLKTLEESHAKAVEQVKALAGEAVAWRQDQAFAAKLGEVEALIRKAQDEWQGLEAKSDEASLTVFLRRYPGSAQAPLARARIAQLGTATRQREAAIERYNSSLAERNYELAHQLALDLHAQFPGHIPAGTAPIPLVIGSDPPGAEARFAGTTLGKLPLVYRYEPADGSKPVIIHLDGHEDVSVVPSLIEGWRHLALLPRAASWRRKVDPPVRFLTPATDGGFVAIGLRSARWLKADGSSAWERNPGDDLDEQGPSCAPLVLPNGDSILGMDGSTMVRLGADGASQSTFSTTGDLGGLPRFYTNDLLGRGTRMAYADGRLMAGPELAPVEVPVPAPVLSGPLVLPSDLDKLIIVADIQGRLDAIEDSTGKVAWRVDLRASEIGPLVPGQGGRLFMVLDGSRLACWSVGVTGAKELWTRPLPGQPKGLPVVTGGRVHVAVGDSVLVSSLEGQELPSLPLPSPATVGVQVGGDVIAVGCSAHLVLFSADARRWSTTVPAPVTALAVGPRLVVVGLADGDVIAFPP